MEKEEAIRRRVEKLFHADTQAPQGRAELFHGAITILSQLHGQGSVQVEELRKAGNPGTGRSREAEAIGALVSALNDLNEGLIGSLRQQLTAGVLADFVALAREALDAGTDASIEVAAVLAAAAYEDTIRRLGRKKTGILDRRKLDQVLEALKVGGVLTDTQFTVAQGT
jgi:hypothetical protein